MANIERIDNWVEPLALAPATQIEPPPLGEGAGCVVAAAVGAAILIVMLMSPFVKSGEAGCAALMLAVVIAGGAALIILLQRRQEKVRKLEAAALATRKAEAEKEATSLASRAAGLLQQSKGRALKLPKCLDDASGWLAQAQREYDQKAYGPFWDAVEQGALNLAAFRDLAQQLTRDSASYYQMLSGRTHSFPVFGITSRTLPDPTEALTELQRILRAGQTNFEFATIWEHRKTREVLISGFRNLGEAVSNLRFAVQGAVDELRSAVSSDMAQLLEEQVRTRKTNAEHAAEQLDKLDQIHKKLEGP